MKTNFKDVKIGVFRTFSLLLFLLLTFQGSIAQKDTEANDSLSKFDKFNKKAEALFKIIPVPIITYSTEAGNTIGLAKFNAFDLVKADTISDPSKVSGLVSFSTKGRINVALANDLIFKENKYVIRSALVYRKIPEYLFGIGNDVSIDDVEEVTTDRFSFKLNALMAMGNEKGKEKDLYAGFAIDIADYSNVETDSTSFLIEDQVSGLDGGTNIGLGISGAYDTRDNRYNAYKGTFISTSFVLYTKTFGSSYGFNKFELDARKYYNPWLKHVIAIQATTTSLGGDIPFYSLALLGGDTKMRGYYEGALRDKILVDTQVEYRLPVWNIFGLVSWIGTGRVAKDYRDLALDGFWLSYGAGLRIKVDSQENINLRIDFGYGPGGISGLYFNFAEAF